MKEYYICSGMAPETILAEEPALNLVDPERNIRILQGGYAALVISSLTGNEWNRILKEYPELLKITDDQGNEIFRVGFDSEGPGYVKGNEVVFGNVLTGSGYATATILLEPREDMDPGQALLDVLGTGLNRLAEAEQMILAVLPSKDRSRPIRNRIVRL